jgi:hypothetical protein
MGRKFVILHIFVPFTRRDPLGQRVLLPVPKLLNRIMPPDICVPLSFLAFFGLVATGFIAAIASMILGIVCLVRAILYLFVYILFFGN